MSEVPESSTERKERSGLVPLATIIASMAGLLIVIVTNARPYIDPILFSLLVAGFSAAILTLFTYYFVARPILPRIQRLQAESARKLAVREIFPDFADLVDRFVELAPTRYMVGIHRPIQSFRLRSPGPELIASAAPHTQLMQTLLAIYHPIVDEPISLLQSDIGRSASMSMFVLSHFASEFYNLLRIHRLGFVNLYIDACRKVGVDSVSYTSTTEYTKFLSKYNQFVASYLDFVRKANRQLGEKLFPEVLEEAPAL